MSDCACGTTEGTMSNVVERFLRYVQVDSQGVPENAEHVPSSECQFGMTRLLASRRMSPPPPAARTCRRWP